MYWCARAAFAVVVALASPLVLAACGGTAEDVADPNDIHIVAVLPLTGSYATRGEKHLAAIQMAFERAEDQGDLIPGRRLRVWVVDGGGKKSDVKKRVADLVKQRLTVDGRALVAAFISSTGPAHEASLPLALELRVPHFEVASGAKEDEFIKREDYPELSDEAYRDMRSFAFSGRALCDKLARKGADFIAARSNNREDPWRRVVIMRGDKEHDRMHARVVRRRLQELADTEGWGGTIVNENDYVMTYPDFSGDGETMEDPRPWREHLTRVKEMYSPDVIFFHLRGDKHNLDFFKDWKRVGSQLGSTKIVTCNMAQKPSLLDPVNPGVIDFLGGKLWFAGRGPLKGSQGNPNWDRFKDQYKAYVPELSPDTWTAGVYDAAMLLALAFAKAGSTDGAAVRDAIVEISKGGTEVDFDEVDRAFRLVRSGQDVDYQGASGPMDFMQPTVGMSSGYSDYGWIVHGVYRVDEVRWNDTEGVGSYVTLDEPAPEILPSLSE